jgi:hypothetical protein
LKWKGYRAFDGILKREIINNNIKQRAGGWDGV